MWKLHFVVPGLRHSFLGLSFTQKPTGKGRDVAQGHPHSKTCCETGGWFSLASVPALTELLPSAEHAAGSWTPGTQLHVTHPRPPPPGRSPQPCSADEDKPFLVAAAAPALSHQVFNVLKLSCPWAPLSLSVGSSVPVLQAGVSVKPSTVSLQSASAPHMVLCYVSLLRDFC